MKTFSYSILLLTTFVVTGCAKKDEAPSTPSEIAGAFCEAFYVDLDIERAAKLSESDFGYSLKHNINMDGYERIKANSKIKCTIVGESIREGRRVVNGQRVDDRATVNAHIEGTLDGKQEDSIIGIYFRQENGRWVVSDLGDPFKH